MTWLDGLTLDTVIVNTDAGMAFKGLLAAVHDDCLVLRDALALDGEDPQLVDGQIVVPRERVLFMQLVPAGGD